jgi:hypothetical protein
MALGMDRPGGMRTAEARRLSSTRTRDPTKAAFPPLFEVRGAGWTLGDRCLRCRLTIVLRRPTSGSDVRYHLHPRAANSMASVVSIARAVISRLRCPLTQFGVRPFAINPEFGDQLWRLSERLTGVYLPANQ